MKRSTLKSSLFLLCASTTAFAQSQAAAQAFAGPLTFAAPIIGTLGALAIILGILGKAAGHPQSNGALGAGVLFIVATFLAKTYSSWVTLFF